MKGTGDIVAQHAPFAACEVGAQMRTVRIQDCNAAGFAAIGDEVMLEVMQLFDFANPQFLGEEK